MQVHHNIDQLPAFRHAVITIGSFDGLHLGHQSLLQRVKELALSNGGESVLVTFSPHPRKVLRPDSPPPVLLTSPEEKIKLVAAAGIDHLVIVPFTQAFSSLTAEAYIEDFLVKLFQPTCIVIGYDHKFGLGRRGNLELLRQYGERYNYQVEEIGAKEIEAMAISSTRIRNAVAAGEIDQANDLLGYNYLLSGTVIKGRQIGRTIGYPTANIQVDHPDKLLPAQGVYAAKARIKGSGRNELRGMLYIGYRPSLHDGRDLSIELNIFDFDQDIYGKDITLEIASFIREDLELNGLPALKEQLLADKVAVLEYFEENKLLSADHIATLKSTSTTLDTAIVILNYNGRKYLEAFLPPLIDSLIDGCRIIVADNLSTDDSVEWMKAHHPAIQLIELPENYGFAGGYNEALQQIEADVFVLLNSDVEVTPHWLAPCLALFEQDQAVGACQPKILAQHDKSRFEYAGAAGGWIDSLGYPFCRGRIFTETEIDKGQYDSVQEIFWATGAALFIRADLFKKLGGFEAEYFAHAEEIDLCWRLKRAGYKVMAQPASTVYHVGGGTLAYKTPRKTYLNFRNTLTTSFKNEPGAKLFWWLPLRLFLDGLAGILFLVQGDLPHIKAIVNAHWHVYPRLRFWYRRRQLRKKQIEAVRIGPDRSDIGCLHDSVVFHYYFMRNKQYDKIVRKQFDVLPVVK